MPSEMPSGAGADQAIEGLKSQDHGSPRHGGHETRSTSDRALRGGGRRGLRSPKQRPQQLSLPRQLARSRIAMG